MTSMYDDDTNNRNNNCNNGNTSDNTNNRDNVSPGVKYFYTVIRFQSEFAPPPRGFIQPGKTAKLKAILIMMMMVA